MNIKLLIFIIIMNHSRLFMDIIIIIFIKLFRLIEIKGIMIINIINFKFNKLIIIIIINDGILS